MVLIYLSILIVVGIILCIFIKYYCKRLNKVLNKIIFSVCCGLLCALLLYTVPPIIHGFIAIQKGLEEEKVLTRLDFSDIYELNIIMPFDDSKTALDSVLTSDDVIIFYRYDCPSCKEEIDDLKIKFAQKNIYWCSTRSPLGKALLDKFINLNIESVPSAVYKVNDKWVLDELD